MAPRLVVASAKGRSCDGTPRQDLNCTRFAVRIMRVAPKCEINPAVRIFLQTRSHRGRNAKHQVHKEDGIMADNRESGGGSNAAVVAIVVISHNSVLLVH